MGRDKCPLTLERFSGRPGGGGRKWHQLNMEVGPRLGLGLGVRGKEDSDFSPSGMERVRAFTHLLHWYLYLCWAGSGAQAWFPQSNAISGGWHCRGPWGGHPEEGSELGVVTESFLEQLAFLQ